ncbi:MAG: hypothetical protein AB7E72_04140 [Lysobacterales bacterium]
MTDVPTMAGTRAAPPLWRVVVAIMAAPGEILRRHASALPASLALGVSGTAFAVFFAQTAIDLHQHSWNAEALAGMAVLSTIGALLGTLGIALLAVLNFVLSRPFNSTVSFGWTLRAFALAYSPTLIYALCGLVFQLTLGWPTTLAFGVTGYLWALGPLHAAVNELCQSRPLPAMVLTTLNGALLLLAWAGASMGYGP